jgi:hypothetical protein
VAPESAEIEGTRRPALSGELQEVGQQTRLRQLERRRPREVPSPLERGKGERHEKARNHASAALREVHPIPGGASRLSGVADGCTVIAAVRRRVESGRDIVARSGWGQLARLSCPSLSDLPLPPQPMTKRRSI